MTSVRQQRPVIGFVGLGDQGAPMARAIGESGFELHVWARRPETLTSMESAPHTVHDAAAGLASASDVLALCLRDDGDIRDVLDGEGVAEGLRPGTVVVNHGTGDPDENVRIAEDLRDIGVEFLDAPVSGGGPGARSRTLTTIVGGARDAYERCEPVFATFSAKVSHMGPVGRGQLTKLLNNAMTLSNLNNAVDLVRLAHKLGLDLAALLEVIGASSGSSASLRALSAEFTPQIAPHLQGLMRKDIEHFADAVRALGADPEDLRARGLAGANGLVETVTLLTGTRTA